MRFSRRSCLLHPKKDPRSKINPSQRQPHKTMTGRPRQMVRTIIIVEAISTVGEEAEDTEVAEATMVDRHQDRTMISKMEALAGEKLQAGKTTKKIFEIFARQTYDGSVESRHMLLHLS